MDLLAGLLKGLTVVGVAYIGYTAFRSIKEGDLWKAFGTIIMGALVWAFIFSSDFRDTLTTTTKNLFVNTFQTDQQPQEKK